MKSGLTEIVVLLDRTGSMANVKGEVINSFNVFVEEQSKLPGEARLTLVQFDSADPHEVIFERRPLADVPLLNGDVYQPRSMTPLYDAMGWTIDHLGEQLQGDADDQRPECVIFAVLTDGLENASREHSKASVFSKVEHQQSVYGWKFVYLGANQDAMKEAQGLGIKHDPVAANVVNFVADFDGTKQAFQSISHSVGHYRSQSRDGEWQSKSVSPRTKSSPS